jgi:LysM repeat protein
MKVSQQAPVNPALRSEAETSTGEAGANRVSAAQAAAKAQAVEIVRFDKPMRVADVFGESAKAPALDATEALSAADLNPGEHYFPGMGPATHVVSKGETLSGIVKGHYPADQYYDGLVDSVAQYNGLEDANLIKVGQELAFPWRYAYTVQSGDTLSKIAAFSENTLADIVANNGIENPDLIRVGQKLVLDGPYGEAYTALSERFWGSAKNLEHTVAAGDTLSAIARQYFPEMADSVAFLVEEFARLNDLADPNLIRVGQQLKVPGHHTYEVQEGDTLWSLNEPLSGGFTNVVKDAEGKPVTELTPGQTVHVELPLFGC